MDKDERLHGETSTIRTNDRGEISGKPVGAAEDGDAASEELVQKQAHAYDANAEAKNKKR